MRKIIFIITAFIILIAGVVTFFVLLPRASTPGSQIPVAPTKIPIAQPTPRTQNSVSPVEQYALAQKLPYVTPGFNIEYLSASEVFMVTIKESPVATNKQAALQWFTENGADPNALKIQYNIYPYLR